MNTNAQPPASPAIDSDPRVPTTIAGFREYGFARFDGLLDDDEYEFVSAIYDELFADPRKHPRFIQLGGVDEDGRQLMPQIGSPHSSTHPQLLETRYFQRVAALARKLLGPEVDTEHPGGHMILKPAGTPRDTPWHQDQAYHSPDFHYRNVNVWLPLDGADIDDGCMWFVPRTHSGTIVPHENCGGGATAVQALDQAFWHANGVPVPLPRGSVSVHHSYCMHYAGPNRSQRPRRAWILVFRCPAQKLERPYVLPWMEERQEIVKVNDEAKAAVARGS